MASARVLRPPAANRRLRFVRSRLRAGTTLIETMVSAMVLVAVISFVTSMLYRLDGVWKDCGHHRAAMCELSNQLGRLTMLPRDELAAAIESLEPSATVARTLHNPVLSGELQSGDEDDLGSRLVLRIDWQRRNQAKPIEMVAWLPETPAGLEEDQ